MPLIRSASKEAFKKNFRIEMQAGKSKEEALAIAYSIKEKELMKLRKKTKRK